MLILYTKNSCAFTPMVLHKLTELGLEYEEKNISDKSVLEELIEKSGSKQTPYLIDSEVGASLRESALICVYLEQHYGGETLGI